MLNRLLLTVVLFACFLLTSGCVRLKESGLKVKEIAKSFWGSSTRVLEEARPQALSKNYPCPVNECFDTILDIAHEHSLKVFIADRKQNHLVIMSVPKSENTTEVGIFLTPGTASETKIEIASLSTDAKLNASEVLFPLLDKKYLSKE